MFLKRNLQFFKSIIFISLFLSGCGYDEKSKDEYEWSRPECANLYTEAYTVFGSGAFGGDMVSKFLTDSVNFRIYTGTYDNSNSDISITCKADSIYVETLSVENNNGVFRVIRVKSYNLNELKKSKKFE